MYHHTFIMAKKLETTQMSFGIKMDELWYTHPTDDYAEVKINELHIQ